MVSYVLTQECTTENGYMVDEFCDVSTKEMVVVSWAKGRGCITSVKCHKYDDVGVCMGQVDMGKTREAGKVKMMDLLI
jgi:hypothetical protein